MYPTAVAEADFGFRRMDVDVDLFCVAIEEEQREGKGAGRHQVVIGGLHGVEEEFVADQPAVDEKIDGIAVVLLHLRHGDEAAEEEDASAFLVGQSLRGIREKKFFFVLADVEEVFERMAAEDLEDAFAQGGDWCDMEEFAVVVAELEGFIGMGEGVMRHQRGDVGEFGLIGTKEFLARGDVEEEIANGDDGSVGEGGFVAADHLAAMDFDACPGGFFGRVGFQRQAGDAGDGREGFAAETERRDGEEVFDAGELRGGMAFKGEHGVVAKHATAVVGDSQQTAAAGFGLNGDRSGPCVERIF